MTLSESEELADLVMKCQEQRHLAESENLKLVKAKKMTWEVYRGIKRLLVENEEAYIAGLESSAGPVGHYQMRLGDLQTKYFYVVPSQSLSGSKWRIISIPISKTRFGLT